MAYGLKACSCHPLKHAIMGQQVNKNLAKFKNFEKTDLHWCSNLLLYSIWELLSNTLFAYTINYMHFFQVPVSSAFFQVFSSFFWKKPISSGNFWTLVKLETKLYFFKYSGRNVSWRVHCSGSKLGTTVKGYVNFWLEGGFSQQKTCLVIYCDVNDVYWKENFSIMHLL